MHDLHVVATVDDVFAQGARVSDAAVPVVIVHHEESAVGRRPGIWLHEVWLGHHDRSWSSAATMQTVDDATATSCAEHGTGYSWYPPARVRRWWGFVQYGQNTGPPLIQGPVPAALRTVDPSISEAGIPATIGFAEAHH